VESGTDVNVKVDNAFDIYILSAFYILHTIHNVQYTWDLRKCDQAILGWG